MINNEHFSKEDINTMTKIYDDNIGLQKLYPKIYKNKIFIENHINNISEYTNYDFGKNWNIIVDILKNDYIFNKINDLYNHNDLPNDNYKILFSPSERSQSHKSLWYYNILEDIAIKLLDDKDSTILSNLENEYENGVIEYEKYVDIKDQIFDNILYENKLNWKSNKYNIIHYIPLGLCHEWNPLFGYTIARKIMPDYKWELLITDNHTTIVCYEQKLFFDILLWGSSNCKNYVSNMILGTKYKLISNKKIANNIYDLLIDRSFINYFLINSKHESCRDELQKILDYYNNK